MEMARSGKFDTVESFRFEILVISLSLSPTQIIRALQNGGLSQFSRAGFSTCTLPESTTSVTEYRENVDNFSPKKIPGLTRFNDITLTRGVITPPNKRLINIDTNFSARDAADGNDFYKWVSAVASFNPALAIAQTVSGTTRNTILKQSQDFRKDMMIIMRDRNGAAARRWFLLDVWPTTYKGGSDLDAMSETKSMESLTLTYEVAFELPNVISAAHELIANIYEGPGSDIISGSL